MAIVQRSSGVISLSSAGSWISNILSRDGLTQSQVFASPSSVGQLVSTFVGSDRVQFDVLLSE